MKTADVVIAGAGIAGIAVAHRLAVHHSISNIILVDPRPPLTLTSNRTGANYRDWWPVTPMVELARRSIQLMDEMFESGAPFTMNRRGYLYVSTRPDFRIDFAEMLAPYRAAGCGPIRTHDNSRTTDYQPAEPDGIQSTTGADVLLDREFIRRTFAYLSPNVTGAVHARVAGTIDTVALGEHLLATAIERGVRLVRGEVVRVDVTGTQISGVGIATERGTDAFATGTFVNAAGPFAGRVAELIGVSLPLINVLQQKVAVPDPHGAIPPEAPFTISLDPYGSLPAGLHIKPDTSAGKPVIKLGWAVNQKPEEPAWDPPGTTEFYDLVLGRAAQLIPALESCLGQSPIGQEAGYYTRTPDELPLISRLACEGAYVVGGLAGYGAMVACAAAEIAASLITRSAVPLWAESFNVDRFANPAYITATAARNAYSGAL